MDIKFLSLAEIILIHENQINAYGGSSGIRDINLLSSAIAMPEAQFSGQYLHNDLFDNPNDDPIHFNNKGQKVFTESIESAIIPLIKTL